jgi:hypothetical protein
MRHQRPYQMLQIWKFDVALEVGQNGMAIFILIEGHEHFLVAFGDQISSVMFDVAPRVFFIKALVLYLEYLQENIPNCLSAQSLKVSCMFWYSFLNWVAKDDVFPLSVSCLIKMISNWYE